MFCEHVSLAPSDYQMLDFTFTLWTRVRGSAVATEPFYVAIITPVIHYCMGGLEIDEASRVLNPKRVPIPGLYAAGE